MLGLATTCHDLPRPQRTKKQAWQSHASGASQSEASPSGQGIRTGNVIVRIRGHGHCTPAAGIRADRVGRFESSNHSLSFTPNLKVLNSTSFRLQTVGARPGTVEIQENMPCSFAHLARHACFEDYYRSPLRHSPVPVCRVRIVFIQRRAPNEMKVGRLAERFCRHYDCGPFIAFPSLRNCRRAEVTARLPTYSMPRPKKLGRPADGDAEHAESAKAPSLCARYYRPMGHSPCILRLHILCSSHKLAGTTIIACCQGPGRLGIDMSAPALSRSSVQPLVPTASGAI